MSAQQVDVGQNTWKCQAAGPSTTLKSGQIIPGTIVIACGGQRKRYWRLWCISLDSLVIYLAASSSIGWMVNASNMSVMYVGCNWWRVARQMGRRPWQTHLLSVTICALMQNRLHSHHLSPSPDHHSQMEHLLQIRCGFIRLSSRLQSFQSWPSKCL